MSDHELMINGGAEFTHGEFSFSDFQVKQNSAIDSAYKVNNHIIQTNNENNYLRNQR